MTDRNQSADQSVDGIEAVPQQLVADRDLAFRVDRDGYTGFIYAVGVDEFEVAHRQYYEDEWRRESIGRAGVLAEVSRFLRCGDVVEMPDLDSVEVSRSG